MSKLNELVADLNSAKDAVKAARGALYMAIAHVNNLRAEIKMERSLDRQVRADYRAAKIEKAKANAADRIARMEAKLAALKAKAGSPKAIKKAAKKASKVTYISKDIAA
jgi:hypothetical protein